MGDMNEELVPTKHMKPFLADWIIAKVPDFQLEELKVEVGILHGIWVPEGFELGNHKPSGYGLGIDPQSVFWYTPLFGTGFYLSLFWNGEPGWSWYIDTKPGSGYHERGGGCLFMRALADAAAILRDPQTLEGKLLSFKVPDWWVGGR